tara:strand:+ start:74397 stop:75314 length:918 start_codon:yes stop_codon:yes gene_type:complete
MSESENTQTANQEERSQQQIPVAIVRRRRVSFAWIVPLLALAAVAYVVWSQVNHERGMMVTIRFDQAQGIKPGGQLVHRGVPVGVVRSVALSEDLSGVEVQAELMPEAEGLARTGTKFWVVRARVSLSSVAGLETLIGPNYIALTPGGADQPIETSFVALDGPPAAGPSADGSLRLVLVSDRLGTLSAGSPVLYREIRVGTVRDAQLTNDASAVMISIDIDPKYAGIVYTGTKFWRSGGVGVDFGLFSGLSVQADSLESAMSSSVSLATPEKKAGERAKVGDRFELEEAVDEDWLKWSPKLEIGP